MDASLAVKWVLPEAGREEALDLLRRWETDTDSWVPDLFFAECANAIRHRAADGSMTAQEAAQLCDSVVEADFRVLSGPALAARGLALALSLGPIVWDACYVAAARRVGAELWTADKQLYAKGRQVYAAIHLLAS